MRFSLLKVAFSAFGKNVSFWSVVAKSEICDFMRRYEPCSCNFNDRTNLLAQPRPQGLADNGILIVPDNEHTVAQNENDEDTNKLIID